MPQTPKPIRIAIITDREHPECRPVLGLPFAVEGYPPIQVEFFQVPKEKKSLKAPAGLQAEAFDLVLDRGNLTGAAWPNLVTGDAARRLQELACELEDLRFKQEINAGIINSATDAIITINEDHVIVGYNKGAEKILGFTREEALGQDLKLIIPPPHKEEHREYVRRFIATREARVIGKHVRLTALRRDGTEFPMSISFSVAEIRGNLYFTGIIRDITEYQEMEDRVLHSERLAAIGNTVAHITHEIKNPLLIIGGFARQLQKAAVLDDKARQKLKIIAEEVTHLESMVAEMRDFLRPPKAQKRLGPIEAVLEEVLNLFEDTFSEHHIKVRRRLAKKLPPVSYDPQKLRQVLMNLFKNALEAMPRGGEVTVATRVNGPNLEVLISDTGEGMSPEVQANIFQPYYTTKEKGTGLGLAICQFIVHEHGGCILVDSTPGKGSTFTIQLPLEEASPA